MVTRSSDKRKQPVEAARHLIHLFEMGSNKYRMVGRQRIPTRATLPPEPGFNEN
jgi:hypothetical protein